MNENENTPPENGTPEPTIEQPSEAEAPTQTIEPAAATATDSAPAWALDKFKRNTIIGGAAVAGAVVALAGAALVDDEDHQRLGGMHGGPQAMQGGPQQMGGGQPGNGQFQQRGPGMHDQGGQNQQGQSGQPDSK